MFFALSDSGRYKIIRPLYRMNREIGCNQLNEHLAINKSTLSYHLRILREVGLISMRNEGRKKFVSLNKEQIDDLLPGLLARL
ncbi:helix-turn-helix transcriptional regulator [Lactobacillus sp. DCY120]|uniref:Helix-turn-helix transcriptional regulator n=1 Tax=Bombilactobacillus apium TaxID=2675299 RepID=A0A850QYU4_9LACO|nr:metalloregulator ArsR/SmtB family transcription factor [Bombilactobacillus apium]NVY97014.1 helix-turn-helix transcriptional regulator [Bombilactobacillus apium]